MIGEKDWKGCGRKRSWSNRDTIPAFGWRALRKPRTAFKVAGILAEIRTEHIPNTDLERYHYINSVRCVV
jgi:hypothetical protein